MTTGDRAVHPWVIAGIVASAMFMELLDSTVILTALPGMAESFGTSPVNLSISITAYLLAYAALIPASGWVADRYGTRNVFIAAVLVFVMASMLCGVSNSVPMFAAARVLQGAGAAMMSPVGRMTMMRVVERGKLAHAINLVAMAGLIGPTIGPAVGGFIITYWSWHWIFFINVPIGLIGIVAVWRYFPNLRASVPPPFDRRGLVLNVLALVGLIYGLQELGEQGGSRLWGAVLTAGGALMGVVAVRHAWRDPQPLLSLDSLRVPSYRASVLGGGLFRMSMYAPSFVLPLLLQLGLGLSAFVSGIYILIGASADVLAKVFVIGSMRRLGFRRLLIWSALLYALYPLALMFVSRTTPLPLLLAILIYGGAIRSFQMTGITTVMFVDLQQELISSASTLSAVGQQLAQAVSVALAALVVNVTVWWLGDLSTALRVADFRPALVLSSLTALWSIYWYLPLAPHTGAEVSGHRA